MKTPDALRFGFAAAASVWMSVDATVKVLLVMILIDYLSGIAAAVVVGKVDSRVALTGGITKAMQLVLIFAIYLLQQSTAGTVNLPVNFGSLTAGFFIVTETISIVENCAKCNVPIPAFLLDALLKVKQTAASPEKLRELEDSTPGGSAKLVAIRDIEEYKQRVKVGSLENPGEKEGEKQ